MSCPRHPGKRVVSECRECGSGFCIECVRETDQTTLCPDCLRRRRGEIERELSQPVEKEGRAAARMERGLQPSGVIPGKKEDDSTLPGGDFLAQGPDEDFSLLEAKKGAGGPKRWLGRKTGRRARNKAGTAAEPEKGVREAAHAAPRRERSAGEGRAADIAGGRGAEEEDASAARRVRRAEGRRAVKPAREEADTPEDDLLRDVVSTLLAPEGEAAQVQVSSAEAVEAPARAPVVKPARARRKRERATREERAERWAFLAQPRSSEYTMIALSWWRAALFIAGVLLGGAVLWAVLNAYLIPRDTEYGALAIVIGVLIGLAFWWKAGRKHGTKLAVQASLVTFFALFVGEFLHWFLIIVKNEAFRTIFFDLVSFKFIWENGAEIMRNVVEAMFPTGFLLLLILPTLAAFIIAFGMPPIPEVFMQFWRALRGGSEEGREARHGLEG